jgi:preprotein translocase subunit SecA
MIKWTLQKIVGSKNQRELKRMQPLVAQINELEEAYQTETEEQLLARVKDWQKHLHRYLPLQLPTKRQLETMDNESISAAATHVQEDSMLFATNSPIFLPASGLAKKSMKLRPLSTNRRRISRSS